MSNPDTNNDTENPPVILVDGSLSKERCEFLLSYLGSESDKLERKEFGVPASSSEKSQLAKAIIAMANSDGGYILLGINDAKVVKGIRNVDLDPAKINDLASSFAKPEIKNLTTVVYEKDALKVGIIFVPPSDNVPHITIKESDKLNKNVIYVRHSGQSEPANHEDMEKLILKAVIKRQKELMRHLEETELQKDVRMIKEHLLGKKEAEKPDFLVVDEEAFVAKIDALFTDENISSIKKVIKQLSKEIVSVWKSTKGMDKSIVLETKVLRFIPLLNKLTYVMILAVENKMHEKIFPDWAEAVRIIYELSNKKDLGISQIDEWVTQGNQFIKAKDHLTYTVPEKEVISRLHILSAYAFKRKEYSLIKKIADIEVETVHGNKSYNEAVMMHPNYSHGSGEGNLVTLFDEARELMTQNVIFFNFFDNEIEESLDSLLRADLLIGFSYSLVSQVRHSGHRHFINFARFYPSRVWSLIESMRDNQKYLTDGFPTYTLEQLKKYINEVIDFANKAYPMISDWGGYTYKDLFPDKAATQ